MVDFRDYIVSGHARCLLELSFDLKEMDLTSKGLAGLNV